MPVARRIERRPPLPMIGLGSFLICVGCRGSRAHAAAAGALALASVAVWTSADALLPAAKSFATQRAPERRRALSRGVQLGSPSLRLSRP
jgi:hypothetical protein